MTDQLLTPEEHRFLARYVAMQGSEWGCPDEDPEATREINALAEQLQHRAPTGADLELLKKAREEEKAGEGGTPWPANPLLSITRKIEDALEETDG